MLNKKNIRFLAFKTWKVNEQLKQQQYTTKKSLVSFIQKSIDNKPNKKCFKTYSVNLQ